jgi:hypothetical protein
MEIFNLTLRQACIISILSIFFAILPTRVFVAISSDVIQIPIIIVPFIIAFMALIPSIDVTFGLTYTAGGDRKSSQTARRFL